MNKVYSSMHLRRAHWAIFSSPLLSYDCNVVYVRDEQHQTAVLHLLRTLDGNSELVNQHFDALGKLPMGKYFEQLLLFILEHDSRYEVLLSNYQVIQNNQTVGELDLVVRNTETDLIEHWELCLKYYLQQAQSNRHDVMLGPNVIDSLDRKMNKLMGHQLTLGNHPNVLTELNLQSIENKLFMKGQLFYHLNKPELLPTDSNPDHEQGWWCLLNEVDKMVTPQYQWTTIWKPDWIGPTHKHGDAQLLSAAQLKSVLEQHFQGEIHSILCVGLQEENGIWIEQTRGFVVNNDWPHGSKQ